MGENAAVGKELVVLVGVYAVINHYYSKSNYVSDDKITINKSTEVETESTGLTDEETDALQSEILNETQDIELPNNNNVYNILLIGVDRRDKTWYGNSDSMILMSINKDTKQIHMTSFMRDLYANIPDVGVKKLNAACAYGGGPLVVRTIEDNMLMKCADSVMWMLPPTSIQQAESSMWMAIRQLHMKESVTLEILIIRERSVSERF